MIRIAGIYDQDLTYLDLIADPIEPSFQEILSDPGAGQFKCHTQDAAVQRTGWKTLLAYGNIVVMHDTQTDKWFAWLIEKRDRVVIAAGEHAEEQWTVSGRGIGAMLQDAVVYPEYGIRRTAADQRNFNFASKPSDWYISSEWTGTPHGVTWSASTTHTRHPKGWPDPSAQWIWSSNPDANSPAGTVFFRKSFTISSPERVSFYCTADNRFNLYIDGELVMSGRHWTQYQRFDIDLDPGTHWVAIRGVNDPGAASGGSNPAGVILTAYQIDPLSDKKLARILHTDTTWDMRPYGTKPPGWDPGDLMKTLVSEAKVRGVDAMQHFNVNVGTNTDSAGHTWPNNSIVSRAFDVGADYLDVLSQTAETSCEWLCRWNNPGGVGSKIYLDLWTSHGVDRSVYDPVHNLDPVIIRRGFNALESSYSGDASGLQTALLLRTNDGWIEETNSGVGIRRKESFLSLGASTEDDHALNVANATFNIASVPQETWSAKAVDMSGHVPFHDFNVGDWVLGPDEDGDLIKQRVIGITLTQDAEGNVYYVPQLNDTRHQHIKRIKRWLKSMAKGTASGRVANASPHDAQDFGNLVDSNPNEVPISHAGRLTNRVSTPYSPWFDSTLVEVYVGLDTAGTTDTVLTVYQNGSSIGTITILAGHTTGSTAFNNDFAANSDKLTVQVTTIGTGAADLTAQARFH